MAAATLGCRLSTGPLAQRTGPSQFSEARDKDGRVPDVSQQPCLVPTASRRSCLGGFCALLPHDSHLPPCKLTAFILHDAQVGRSGC